jgi:CARDB
MLRAALITALVALLAPVSSAAAATASVTLTACQPRDRAAEFEARMEKVAGSARMKLRFALEARKRGKPWRRMAAPELGGWRTADPDTTRFIVTRRVTELVGPNYYRTVVRFRWLDADGDVVAATRARSRACWQPDHRPNLKLLGLSVEDGTHYVVRIANDGRSASGAFDLEISGLPLLNLADGLEPGEERFVAAEGPACAPTTPVTAKADPSDEVDERNEGDNALTVRCP